jgi:hypothetical protein
MNKIALSMLFSLILVAGCAAPGGGKPEMTVGDVLAKGGKRLTSPELKQLVPGSTMEGPASRTGNPFRTVQQPDGRFSGESTSSRGRFSFDGTWTINDQDQYCSVITTAAARSGPTCASVYVLDGMHYMALKDEPATKVLERRFTK